MKKKIITISSFLIGVLCFSQTEIYFKYDEAGNQRYRGPDSNAKPSQTNELSTETVALKPRPDVTEDEFFKQIRLYPVPVDKMLTIEWTETVGELISSVSLYQHSTINWKFRQNNIADLGGQIRIDMSDYYPGVYILHFELNDGRIINRSIIKN